MIVREALCILGLSFFYKLPIILKTYIERVMINYSNSRIIP
jgi:hypothetical protein